MLQDARRLNILNYISLSGTYIHIFHGRCKTDYNLGLDGLSLVTYHILISISTVFDNKQAAEDHH